MQRFPNWQVNRCLAKLLTARQVCKKHSCYHLTIPNIARSNRDPWNIYKFLTSQKKGFELLTDIGEDSKLVHRRKRPKVDTLFSSIFSDASERRVWLSAESKLLASTFGRFCLYRLISLQLCIECITIWELKCFDKFEKIKQHIYASRDSHFKK